MTDTCEIVGRGRQTAQGFDPILPAGFVPLRLCVEAEGLHIEVTSPSAIVGRHSDADLRLADPEISRRHCRFVFADGQWRIHDMNSLNGIYVNHQRMVEAPLYVGDLVRIGGVRLLVEAATPLREAKFNDKKLRQIVNMLPMAKI